MYEPLAFGIREEAVVGTSNTNKIEAEVQDEGEGNMVVIRASDNEDEGGDDGDDGDDGEDRIMPTRPARVSAPRARKCFTQMEDDEYVVYQESYHEDSSYYL